MAAAIVESGDGGHLRTYPGGKNGAGIYQRLINLMPPHRCYIEAFLGSGAILRRKKPAAVNFGIDADAGIIARHSAGKRADVQWICGDALRLLKAGFNWQGDELVYCDPPYLGAARSRAGRAIYQHEMLSEPEHAELLRILTTIPAMVMISGYRHPLYDRALRNWRCVEYQAMTRGGLKPEAVWMNYPQPRELHDYSFLGEDFHDRCRIQRKIARWTRRLAGLPVLERAAVIAAIGAAADSD